MNNDMKYKSLFIALSLIALTGITSSCHKEPDPPEKNKIDIKGTLMNGDMKHPTLEATFDDKTVKVVFLGEYGDCIVSVENRLDSVIFRDTVQSYPYVTTSFYMGDQPLGRYRLHITNGIEGAEGWFNNFKIVAMKPKS